MKEEYILEQHIENFKGVLYKKVSDKSITRE